METKDQKQKPKAEPKPKTTPPDMPEEFGGSGKAEPTRYGDWEVAGRCSDF